MKKKQTLDPKIQTAQSFLNIKDIKDNHILHSNDDYLFSYIWVKAKDSNLLNENERGNFFLNISLAFENEKEPWQLISIPRIVDISNLINNLFDLRRKTNHSAKLNLLNHEIEAVKNMSSEGIKEPLIFLKLWQKNCKNGESIFLKRVNDLTARLSERSVKATVFDKKDITYLCKIYADLGQHHGEDDGDEIIPVIKSEKNKKDIPISDIHSLLSMLTSVGGITFKNSKLIVGSTIGRIYSASRFTANLNYNWLVKIMNCTESITCITFNLGNSNELADALSRAVSYGLKDAVSTKDARMQKQSIKQAEDSDELLSMLEQEGASIGQVSILTMPFTDDEDELEEVCRRVSMMYAVNRIKLRPLGQLQQEAFKTLSPYYPPDTRILDISERIMPLQTLMGGSPMTVNIYKDDNGLYFAKTVDGGIMALDLFKRENDRTNSNFVITGKPGTGKSTAVKHIIENLYMLGVKILLIDPEREYKDLCKNLGGSWIDCGGGVAKINILEVKTVPADEDDEKDQLYTSGENVLANHLRTLDIFFATYIPSLCDLDKARLKKTLIELYTEFNINWETDVSTMVSTDFPIFSDLYRLLEEKSKTDVGYENLTALLFDIAMGADSFLWNGHTNIDINNNFICFDTHTLNNAGDNVKRAQYFNILTLCWKIISENREEAVALVSDETYILIDPEIPQTLMFLRNISKRCRKYNGLLAVISQSLVDFLDKRIKMYGQALLENPTYKIFFGTDGQNLKETTALYNLSESEQNILLAGVQKEALAFIGSQRVKVRFDLPPYKIDLMGKGGGR